MNENEYQFNIYSSYASFAISVSHSHRDAGCKMYLSHTAFALKMSKS
jgi:hypothetical protein